MMIHVRIITPKGIYKEFDTPILNIPTVDGERGLLPNHMPLVTMLQIGAMSSIEDGQRNYYAIFNGLFYFRDNVAEIMTDTIENSNDIDLDRALSAKERAEKRLASHDSNVDQKRAELALKRALNRIHVSELT